MSPIRTSVTIVSAPRSGWLVHVEQTHERPVFSTVVGTSYTWRTFPLPTVYRSRQTAERAGRALALDMHGTFRLPPEHA